MSDDLHLSMGITAKDDASPAIRAVEQSFAELQKTLAKLTTDIRKSFGAELTRGLKQAITEATEFKATMTTAATETAKAVRADTAAVDQLRDSLRGAAAEQRRVVHGTRVSGSTRSRIEGDNFSAWRTRERIRRNSERVELRHLRSVRNEYAAQRREMNRRVGEVYHHGRHAIRSVNHPEWSSVGFWTLAGAAFGVEAGKHLIEAAKNIDTATTRLKMQPGVSPADAIQVRTDALKESIRIGVDPAEIVRLTTQGLKDGLPMAIAKTLPSVVNAATQTMGGSLDKDGDELAKAVRESYTVGWIKDPNDARSLMNQIAGLSTSNGNSPEKMNQFLASGGIGRGAELGWTRQQTLAFGAALNGSGERTGFGSARLMAQIPEIRAGMEDKYRKATREKGFSEERSAILNAPATLGYGSIREMSEAMATPEGLVDLFSRMQGIDEKKRALIEKGFGFGPQFNAVEAEMGANGGKRYYDQLHRENELSGQTAGNDDLSKNGKLWQDSIEFKLNQLKASATAVQADLGDVVKDDILTPFTSWWVEISEALLNGGMKADLHRAIQSFIQGLGFTDLTAALNSLKNSVGTFNVAEFFGGIGEGLRVVVDQFARIAKLFGFVGDGGARGMGKALAEILGASIALRIAAPAFSLLTGLASGVLAVKAAFEGVALATKLTDVAGGLRAVLALDLAGGAAGLLSVAGGIGAVLAAAKFASDRGMLQPPKSWDMRGFLEFLDQGIADRIYGKRVPDQRTKDDLVSPPAPKAPPSVTLGPDDYWNRKRAYLQRQSYDGGDDFSDLRRSISWEPSDSAGLVKDATLTTARGVYATRDAVDALARSIRGTALAGASVAIGGGGDGGGMSPGHAFGNLRYGRTSSGSYRSSPGGAGAGGGGGMTAVSKDLTPESRALLDTLASGEAPDYNVMNGGGRFSDYSHHPGGRAAGRYQFLPSTWRRVSSALGLKDFSPESQDKGAWWLAQQDYKTRTGRNLQADLASKDPSRIAAVGRALHSTWVSLNGSFGGKYDRYLSRQSSGAVAGGGGGGASAPGQVRGMLKIGSESYRYGSGGAGGSASVPFGDYPINPDAPGAWGRAHNAMAVNGTGSIWDKSLGRMRTGIEMHAASTAAMVTHGCLGFLKDEYPRLKARVREMIAKTGHAYLHVGPNGATITPNKVESVTPAAVVQKMQQRRVPAAMPGANVSADNNAVVHNHFNISHPDGHTIADRVVKHFATAGGNLYHDVGVNIS